MHHKRFPIQHVEVDGRGLSVRYGTLLVAVQEGRGELDWECLVTSNDEFPLERAPCALTLESDTRRFAGDAIVVRSDGIAHVFRGVGPLGGLGPEELAQVQ